MNDSKTIQAAIDKLVAIRDREPLGLSIDLALMDKATAAFFTRTHENLNMHARTILPMLVILTGNLSQIQSGSLDEPGAAEDALDLANAIVGETA